MAVKATQAPARRGRPPGSKNTPPAAPARPMGPQAPVPQAPSPLAQAQARLAANKPLTQAQAQALVTRAPVARPGPMPRPPMPAAPPMATQPPVNGGRPNMAPRPPAAAPVDVSALLAQISAQSTEIVRLETAVTALKAKPTNVRTIEEILDGGNVGLPDTDWRHDYQGTALSVYPWEETFAKKTGHGTLTIFDGILTDDQTAYAEGHGEALPTLACFLAIPRSNDVGGKGTQNRAAGKIALHWLLNEEGNYEGEPQYVTLDQLSAVRADREESE
jgi:hypothetical protein